MGLFAPDSILWLGIVLGLVGRRILLMLDRAISILITDAARRFADRRAHARAMRDLQVEAQEEADS